MRSKEKSQNNPAEFYIQTYKRSPRKFLSKIIIVNNKIKKKKVAILLIKINSKIVKLKSYNKIINNLIYNYHKKKTIKKYYKIRKMIRYKSTISFFLEEKQSDLNEYLK